MARFDPLRLLEDAVVGARFLAALPAYLRRPLTPDEARAILRRRLERREADFLALARQTMYRPGRSPYRRLLRLAGCEYGDLDRLVWQDGLEGALKVLLRRGVYLTIDEFKGRRPVVRGSAGFTLDPRDLSNPLAGNHLPGQSGGSRGSRTPIRNDVWGFRDRALARCVYFEAVGAASWEHAIWEVPGGLPILNLLQFTAAGARPARWFSQLDPAAPGLDPRYRWSGQALRWGSLLAGVPLPRPETVLQTDPLPIAAWMAEVLRGRRTPHLYTPSSSAVRVCEAARVAGLSLHGARFMLSSEPATAARQAAIRRAGGESVPTYGSTEAGIIADACAARQQDDGMHLLDDLHGVIQPGAEAGEWPDLAPTSLLFTTLRRRPPFILLNVSIGDQAEIIPSRCGCPLERVGWVRQIHAVRSFEKLTAGGMTLLDSDVIRVLEEVLPARFGGSPIDYQLVETLSADGRSTLRLLVHPRVGPLDAAAVADAFLAAIGGQGAARVMELQWRQGDVLRVERAAPRLTPAGKILHLHQERVEAPPR